MTLSLRNSLTQVQFALRNHYFGKLPLRTGLPIPENSERIAKEREFYRLVLSKAFLSNDANKVDHVIDVGCRNWSYASSLATFFPSSQLTGIEVDGGRRYWNLYRRMDFAHSYAEDLRRRGRKATFLPIDFLAFNGETLEISQRPLFCFFFPFVSENPCLKWGLPLRYVNFVDLLRHILFLMENVQELTVFSAHQGEWEAKEARKAYAKAGLCFTETLLKGEDSASLWPSGYDTHLLKVIVNKHELKTIPLVSV